MTSIKKALRKKKVKAWAILDRKNIMWVGCDGGNHLEIFPSKKLATKAFTGVGFRPEIIKVEISYVIPPSNY